MSMIEQWTQWKPTSYLAETNNKKNKLKVIFEESINIYRVTNEFLRKKIINELDKQYGENFHKEWTFFKVANSEYIRWISENSYDVWDYTLDIHFSFITNDLILDIISVDEPKIELM